MCRAWRRECYPASLEGSRRPVYGENYPCPRLARPAARRVLAIDGAVAGNRTRNSPSSRRRNSRYCQWIRGTSIVRKSDAAAPPNACQRKEVASATLRRDEVGPVTNQRPRPSAHGRIQIWKALRLLEFES